MSSKISVIIPFYNGEATLKRAVESVKNQSFKDWELILVNDGSTDNSGAIAEVYSKEKHIKLIQQKNLGVSAARNAGAKLAKGEYLIFLDSDDILTQECLNLISLNIDESLGYFVWGVRRLTKDKIIDVLPKKKTYFSLLSGTYAIRRDLFWERGGFDDNLKFGENTEFFHRVNLFEVSYKYLDFLGLIYNNNENGGSKNLQNMIDSNLIILNKHKHTLSEHTKRMYHQVIGVNQLRFRHFSEARFHLWKAFCYKPWEFTTLARFAISLWPWLAKKFYSEKVKIQ